jgi:hypothetical protein
MVVFIAVLATKTMVDVYIEEVPPIIRIEETLNFELSKMISIRQEETIMEGFMGVETMEITRIIIIKDRILM